jgi:hypothetical protein
MKKTTLVGGVTGILLGGLWMLQGLGIVQIRPILCFVDCAPVQGPSLTWVSIGFVVVNAGVIATFFSIRRRS